MQCIPIDLGVQISCLLYTRILASDLTQTSEEVLVIVFMILNMMACISSPYIADWIKVVGVKHAFGDRVGIQYAVLWLTRCLLFIFLWKRIRAFTGRFGPMKRYYVVISM